MKKLFALMVVCAALVAVGCGEGEAEKAAPPADTTDTTAPPADTTDPAADPAAPATP